MDIGSSSGYPNSALSNFAGHRFEIDGIVCNSMEGFLQALKFKNRDMQIEVCKLIGKKAKFKGKKKKWWREQKLYWNDTPIDRHSDAYQELLDRAYYAMASQSKSFQRALLASGKSTLTHSMGKKDPSHTVLTVREFCGRLSKLRDRLNNGEIKVIE